MGQKRIDYVYNRNAWLWELVKVGIYVSIPVAMVVYFSDPTRLKEGLLKKKYIVYPPEASVDTLFVAPPGYEKKEYVTFAKTQDVKKVQETAQTQKQ